MVHIRHWFFLTMETHITITFSRWFRNWFPINDFQFFLGDDICVVYSANHYFQSYITKRMSDWLNWFHIHYFAFSSVLSVAVVTSRWFSSSSVLSCYGILQWTTNVCLIWTLLIKSPSAKNTLKKLCLLLFTIDIKFCSCEYQ